METGSFMGEFQGKRYAMVVPKGYKGEAEEKRWPLIAGLHWHHGSGHDLLGYFKNRLLYGNFIMVCPNGTNESWTDEDEPFVLALIEEVKRQYQIDPDKVFLLGVSAGAHLTYHTGLRHPEIFCGIVVIAGSLSESIKRWGTTLPEEKERKIPVFIMHGEKDNLLPLWNASWSRDTLEKKGYEVTYVVIPGHGHDVPHGEIYQIMDWLKKIPPKEHEPI